MDTSSSRRSIKTVFEGKTLESALLKLPFKVDELKGYEIPEFSRHAKGQAIVNLINIEQGELVSSILTQSNSGKVLDEDITQENQISLESKIPFKNLFLLLNFFKGSKT